MPKETFFNLPDDKRERITAVAIEEFGENEYADVSISRMVAKAGIAKGSFYQYFEDKEDLYTYLLSLIYQKKQEFFSLDHPDPMHMGVFRYLHWIIQSSVAFELAYPELMKVGYRAFNQTGYPKTLVAFARQEARKFYVHLVTIGKEQGDIALEIDDSLAAFMFDLLISGLGQYLLSHVEIEDALHGQHALFEHPDVVRIFEQTIDILEHGMGVGQAMQVSAVSTAA
jgi:AcrR family transcriptional regulator